MSAGGVINGCSGDSKRVKLGSCFAHIDPMPLAEAFLMKDVYLADENQNKINLGIGAYRTDEGKPWVLPVVRTIEAQMSSDPTLNKEYLPLSGMPALTEGLTRLLLGESSLAITQNRAFGVQSLSGTGALHMGARFLRQFHNSPIVYIPTPTWGNHVPLLKSAGFTDIRKYRYWDSDRLTVDIAGLLEDLRAAPEHSIILLHLCAHNPTGSDPTHEQWQQIIQVMKERDLFPFLDCAYQGFVSGDLDLDAWAVREFVKEGMELFAAQSCSKNFGLYNERVGQLCVVLSSPEAVIPVRSQLVGITRAIWSNCPNHGARIVAMILNNPSLLQEWKENLVTMSERILKMRQELYQALKATGIHWDHMLKQKGMFSYTGLTETQVEHLISKHHVYLMKSGRISLCGLNAGNMPYFVDAVVDTLQQCPSP